MGIAVVAPMLHAAERIRHAEIVFVMTNNADDKDGAERRNKGDEVRCTAGGCDFWRRLIII